MALASAESLNSAFKDDNFYQCVVEGYYSSIPMETDANNSNEINLTEEQLSDITELDCSNRNIKDVSGIEKLTHLTYLNLENNQISNIDLSNNKYLFGINIENNNCYCVDISKNYLMLYNMLKKNAPSSVYSSRNNQGEPTEEEYLEMVNY